MHVGLNIQRVLLIIGILLSSCRSTAPEKLEPVDFLNPYITDSEIVLGTPVELTLKALPVSHVNRDCITTSSFYNQQTIRAELLTIEENAYLIVCTKDLYNPRVARVDERVVRSAVFHTPSERIASTWTIQAFKNMDSARFMRAALWSRYPQGVSEELLKDLLVAYKQEALIIINR